MSKAIRLFRGDTAILIRVWVLAAQWMTKAYRVELGRDRQVQFFWRNVPTVAIRIGRHGRRSFSERGRHLLSIPNRWHYLLGGRITIIASDRRGR